MTSHDITFANKVGDKVVDRFIVNVHRGAGLLHFAVIHHEDFVGQRQRLFLVMRHEQERDAEALLQFAQFILHILAQLGIQR